MVLLCSDEPRGRAVRRVCGRPGCRQAPQPPSRPHHAMWGPHSASRLGAEVVRVAQRGACGAGGRAGRQGHCSSLQRPREPPLCSGPCLRRSRAAWTLEPPWGPRHRSGSLQPGPAGCGKCESQRLGQELPEECLFNK